MSDERKKTVAAALVNGGHQARAQDQAEIGVEDITGVDGFAQLARAALVFAKKYFTAEALRLEIDKVTKETDPYNVAILTTIAATCARGSQHIVKTLFESFSPMVTGLDRRISVLESAQAEVAALNKRLTDAIEILRKDDPALDLEMTGIEKKQKPPKTH